MTILKILKYPDKRLRIIAKPVNKMDKNIFKIIYDMIETMYIKHGIGLAATQVNIHKQIIIIDISEKYDKPIVLINPQYLKKNGSIISKEGCLSIPDQYNSIVRFKCIQITALNIFGKKTKIEANNLLSICIQHEIDHLIGKLFIDYI